MLWIPNYRYENKSCCENNFNSLRKKIDKLFASKRAEMRSSQMLPQVFNNDIVIYTMIVRIAYC